MLFSKGRIAVLSVRKAVASNPSQEVTPGNAHLHMCHHHHFVGKVPECEAGGIRGGKSE